MAETKYGHLIKSFPSFQDYGLGSYRQGTEMNGKFFGYDLNVRYGNYWVAGKMGGKPFETRACDYDQIMIWMGTNTIDLGYLGAEVELCLGEEKEKHMVTTSTAVAVPKGIPHFPATIGRMDDRFIFFVVSIAPEVKATPVPSAKKSTGLVGWREAKYMQNIQHLAFTRNGPWHYGPLNQDTHCGAITNINGVGFDFHMSYESMNKAPYRFGPIPDKPHVHPYTEFLLFMGADCNDLSDFPAEAELYMGKEMERHLITTPSVAIQPKGHPHCPLIVNKQDKPWIFAVLRPWGHGGDVFAQGAPTRRSRYLP